MRPLLIIAAVFTIQAFGMTACAKENQKPNPYAVYKFPMKHSFIALSPLPGRVDLEADMKTITANEITSVVTLVSNEELENIKYQLCLKNTVSIIFNYFTPYSGLRFANTRADEDNYCMGSQKSKQKKMY